MYIAQVWVHRDKSGLSLSPLFSPLTLMYVPEQYTIRTNNGDLSWTRTTQANSMSSSIFSSSRHAFLHLLYYLRYTLLILFYFTYAHRHRATPYIHLKYRHAHLRSRKCHRVWELGKKPIACKYVPLFSPLLALLLFVFKKRRK